MVVSQPATNPMTIDEFVMWSHLPEQEDQRFELVDGLPKELSSPGVMHGLICSWIAHLLWGYVMQRGNGRILTNDTGIVISRRPNTLRGADVVFLAQSKPFCDVSSGHITDVPALVVEVYSPSYRSGRLSQRIAEYFSHGIPMIWVVYPEDQVVDVYRPNHSVQAHTITNTLTGYNELSDLQMKVADIFNYPGS